MAKDQFQIYSNIYSKYLKTLHIKTRLARKVSKGGSPKMACN